MTSADVGEAAVRDRTGPPVRGSVRRERLISRVAEAPSGSLVVVQAPAGFGKTTLLFQVATEDSRPTASLRLDASHNDPVHLLEDLDGVFTGLGIRPDPEERRGRARVGRSVPRLLARLDPGIRVVLLLDEAEVLVSTGSRDILAQLAIDLPESVTMVVATRTDIGLPLATLRTSGRVVELASEDLALSPEEVRELARGLGVDGRSEIVAHVGERMEGWPVGVYLMLLAVANGDVTDEGDIRGDDIHLAEYINRQILDGLTPTRRRILTQISVLDDLTGSMCDWLLERSHSQAMLEELADANLLIARVDHFGGRFRLHAILREYLHSRLEHLDPDLHRELHLRASDWFEQRDRPTEAVRHAMEVDDVERVASLVQAHAQPLFDGGRVETVNSWFAWFDQDERRHRYPGIAVMAAMTSSAQGDEVAALRWKSVVHGHRGALGMLEPLVCFLDALTEAEGPDQMLADARCAVRGLGLESSWHPAALTLEGLALLACGDTEQAEDKLLHAAEVGERYGSLAAATFAYAACSLLAASDGRHARAGDLAARSRLILDDTELDLHATSVLSLVATARTQLGRGEPEAARRTLNQAYGSTPRLTPMLPGISAMTLVEMAAVAIELADFAGARQVLQAADRIMAGKSLGRIEVRRRSLGDLVDATPGGVAGVSTLTPAELRLLPHLATHLSFPEIGDRLFISRHTVKTQAMAIYRKLGASNRSEAVSTAREVGLLPTQRF